MKKIQLAAFAAGACLLYSQPAWAQIDQEASLFVGFSVSRAAVADADSGDVFGGEIDYTYYLDRRFGFTLDAAGHWGSVDAPPNVLQVATFDFRQGTFLAGPHIVLWRGLTSEAGFSALAGVAWRALDADIFGTSFGSETKFAWGATLNFDWRITDRVWVRLPQPALVFTKFDLDDGWNADFRVSAGLVLKAGQLLQ